jgi:hypothetical protein
MCVRESAGAVDQHTLDQHLQQAHQGKHTSQDLSETYFTMQQIFLKKNVANSVDNITNSFYKILFNFFFIYTPLT